MASKAKKGEEDFDEDEVTELLSEGDSVQDGDNEDMDDDLEAAEDDIDEDDDLEAAEDDIDEDDDLEAADDEDGGMEDEPTRLHVEPIAVRVEQEPETRCRRFSGIRSLSLIKGIVRPFELEGETRLIRFTVMQVFIFILVI